MLKRILLKIALALVGLILLAMLLASVAMPLMRYLSHVKNPALGKRNGQAVSRIHGQTIVAVIGHPDDAEYCTGGNGSIPNLGRVRESEQRAAGKIEGYARIVCARNPD